MAIGYYIASIKISKQDVNGDDISSKVSELLRFTLNYSDITPITFEVLSKVEYSTYFQFQIKFQGYGDVNDLAYSVDNYMRNYILSANKLTAQSGSILVYDGSSTGNSLGYFNTSSGEYTLGYTPNTIIYASASATIYSTVGSSDAQLIFAQQLSPGNYQTIFASTPTSIPALTPGIPFSISGAFYPIKGETYITYVTDSTTSDLTSSYASFNINQNQPPTFGVSGSGIDNIIYTTGDNNENPLYGNAGDIIENPHYSKVDYIEYVLPERDFELILSGSGTKSNVKQYNYELLRSTYPRYVGSRTISNGFNLNTLPVGALTSVMYGALSLPTYGGGLGLKPNVERTTPYFLYFNKVINTSPILKGKAGFELGYLINEDGEAFNLSNQTPIYENLIGSFETGKKAYTSLLSNENTIYNLNQPILLSGQFYEPVLYNLSSSLTTAWSSQIDFLNQDGSSGSGVPNFNSTINYPAGVNMGNVGANYPFYLDQFFGAPNGFKNAGDWLLNGVVSPIGTSALNQFQFTTTPQSSVTVTFSGNMFNTDDGSSFIIYGEIFKNGQFITSGQGYAQYTTNQNTTYGSFSVSYTFTPLLSDVLSFRIVKTSPSNGYTNFVDGLQIKITTSNLNISPATSPYWYVGSTSNNVLTGSQGIYQAYNNFIQTPITNSGFRESRLVFNIKKDDEFRFEYDENPINIYKVLSVSQGPTGSLGLSTIYVTLDKPIPSIASLNINHFTIRRKTKQVGIGVTLDAPFIANISGGFLFPEYPTQKLKNNFPTIVQNLNSKNII